MANKDYIGKIIGVKIDRELGSKHPKHEPIKDFTGKCIAVIHRINDDDDKLVIIPKDKNYSNDAIEALVEFQERFFEHIIIR